MEAAGSQKHWYTCTLRNIQENHIRSLGYVTMRSN
jgi:hypothetical protein